MTQKSGSAEARLARAAAAGERFHPKVRTKVKASFLRDLLLGKHGEQAITAAGFRMTNVRIEGRLDLDGLASPGGALPTLSFKNCVFMGGFDGSNSHFGMLEFEDCQFDAHGVDEDLPLLNLTGASCNAFLPIIGCRAAHAGSRFDVKLSGMRIAGPCDLARSHFDAGGKVTAFHMSGTSVGGHLWLNSVDCTGNAFLDNLNLSGDLWIVGSRFATSPAEVSDGIALRLQSIRADGSLHLRVADDCQPAALEASGEDSTLQESELPGFSGHLMMINCRFEEQLDLALGQQPARLPRHITIQRVSCRGDIEVLGPDKFLAPSSMLGLAILNTQGRSLTLKGLSLGSSEHTASELAVKDSSFQDVTVSGCGSDCAGLTTGAQDLKSLPWVDLEFSNLSARNLSIYACDVHGNLKVTGCDCSGSIILGGRYVSASCRGTRTQGSLDIYYLEIPASSNADSYYFDVHLDLSNMQIGEALTISREGSEKPDIPPRLIAARYHAMQCFPGTRLVEMLWLPDEAEFFHHNSGLAQYETSILLRDDKIVPLHGRADVLHNFVKQHGISLDTPEQAIEYGLLFFRHVHGDEGAFYPMRVDAEGEPVLPWWEDPVLGPDPRSFKWHIDEPHFRDFMAQPAGSGFAMHGQVLYAKTLIEARFSIEPPHERGGQAVVEVFDGPAIATADMTAGLFEGERTYPDPIGGGLKIEKEWVTPGLYPDMVQMDRHEREMLAFLISPAMQRGLSPGCIIDLRNTECGTLDDADGLAWGQPGEIRLNHFRYHRIGAKLAKHAASEPRNPPRPRYIRLLDLLRALPFAWRFVSKQTLDHLRRAEEYGARGWKARRFWLFRQQLDRDKFPSLSRYRISSEATYHPQPFTQAILVARAEGRFTDATNLAITRRKLEWAMFSHRWRRPFAAGGAALGLVSALSTGAGLTQTLLAVLLGGIIGFWGSDMLSGFLRTGFGYMNKAFNAVLTLMLAFLLGWGGVWMANDRGLLTLDLVPVAGAARTDGGRLTIGTPYTQGSVEADISCYGLIREPLYALDVLLPLVDLREESKCSVGRSDRVRVASPGRGDVFATLASWTIDSEAFWAFMKAFYAILGWVVISLSILTFTNVVRSGGNEG